MSVQENKLQSENDGPRKALSELIKEHNENDRLTSRAAILRAKKALEVKP